MDNSMLAGIILFGLPIWAALIIWILRKVFKIHTIWD